MLESDFVLQGSFIQLYLPERPWLRLAPKVIVTGNVALTVMERNIR
jgi:hypothetical protein